MKRQTIAIRASKKKKKKKKKGLSDFSELFRVIVVRVNNCRKSTSNQKGEPKNNTIMQNMAD